MPTLKYKTRGNASPQGKPRVYFCSHSKDFEKFFESISDEILTKQNCVVWYKEQGAEYDKDELFADLSQMQLFVMPVTTELLCTPNFAIDAEFSYAIEHHIPVLPLMQESGLEELFNKKCGDLQFLDKNSHDDTAISFDEKLEKYLSSVLIGDELAEKIRAAFDAYVFLSYRKKDRKYAQELMRLIHKNEFCRDIAIWYDEFLTPGENFNDSIKEALQKSGLFVLAVTPNLVNEINYVMTTEYPMAKQEGKLILPAELVPTDKQQLHEKYEDIPEPTDAHNDSALSQALLESIKKMAIKENDTSPEHNFFIGLAYLGGVDVEVDYERAVSLITSAADAGLVEAATKLVEMYRTGLGVTRSYETAISWQERLISLRENEYNTDPTVQTLDNLFWAINWCGDYYKELANLTEAKEKYSLALDIIEKSQFAENHLSAIRDLAIGYERLGTICKAEGKLSEAIEYHEKSLSVREEIVADFESPNAYYELSISYTKLGDICRSERNIPAARKYYEKSLEIRERLVSETGLQQAYCDLATVYSKLGTILVHENNISQAIEYQKKGLEIREKLAAETNTPMSRRDLSISYELLGNIYKKEGNIAKAREFYEKTLAIAEKLANETDTLESYRDLSVSYGKLGDICKAEGDIAGAREYYEKDIEICEDLVTKTGTLEAYRDLSISYTRIGDIYISEGNASEAKKYYEKNFEICKRLVNETGSIESLRDLAVSYEKLGSAYKNDGDISKAREYFEKDIEISEQLAKKTNTIESLRDLSVSYERLGDICKAEDNLPEAKLYYEKSFDISEKLSNETGTIESIRDLAISCDKLVSIFESEKNLDKAKMFGVRSLQLREKVVKEIDTLESYIDLSMSYDKLGDIYRMLGDKSEAKKLYKKCVELSEKIMLQLGTPGSYNDLAVSYYKLYVVCVFGRKYLKKAIELYETLCKMCPDVAKYRDLLNTLKSQL